MAEQISEHGLWYANIGAGPLSYERMAADTIRFLDNVIREPVRLLGVSDGAVVALTVALRRPDLARRLRARRRHLPRRRLVARASWTASHQTSCGPATPNSAPTGASTIRWSSGIWAVTRGGQGRDRTADLPLFRRSLVPTELPGPGCRRAPRRVSATPGCSERS